MAGHKTTESDKPIPGNRCFHDPAKPRFCNIVKRGKGGHPPVIGLVSDLFKRSYSNDTLLPSWQSMNASGRRRRSEIREVNVSVGQFMFTKWVQLETLRCATPGNYCLQVPDAKHIARKISQTNEWGYSKISVERVNTIFAEWKRAGYISSHQQREQTPTGEWKASPAVRTFTKKFFVELGGNSLWKKIQEEGAKKLEDIKKFIESASVTLSDYLNPGVIVTPQQAFFKKAGKKSGFIGNAPSQASASPEDINPITIRESNEYQLTYSDLIASLSIEHRIDKPPNERWGLDEISDNATRIADKIFDLD